MIYNKKKNYIIIYMDELKEIVIQNKEYYILIKNIKNQLQNIYNIEDLIDKNILVVEDELNYNKKILNENMTYLKKICNSFYE